MQLAQSDQLLHPGHQLSALDGAQVRHGVELEVLGEVASRLGQPLLGLVGKAAVRDKAGQLDQLHAHQFALGQLARLAEELRIECLQAEEGVVLHLVEQSVRKVGDGTPREVPLGDDAAGDDGHLVAVAARAEVAPQVLAVAHFARVLRLHPHSAAGAHVALLGQQRPPTNTKHIRLGIYFFKCCMF
jgi:hypothetical protein